MDLPYTSRGYRYTPDELAQFKAAKRAGIMPKQAHAERYTVEFHTVGDWILRKRETLVSVGGRHYARIWKQTRPGYEREIGALILD